MSRGDFRARLICSVGVSLWGACVLLGMFAMLRYEMAPTAFGGDAPGQWPKNARLVSEHDHAKLVMSLHPRCPCSRASLRELAVLMARAGDRVTARIYFVEPRSAPANWLDSDLWRDAQLIPGVSVAVDRGGEVSKSFGATTSGQVELYGAGGALLFSGGITDSRGHEGDNAGLDAILALLRGRAPSTRVSAVYGCPLY
jgi:hypothetical protein